MQAAIVAPSKQGAAAETRIPVRRRPLSGAPDVCFWKCEALNELVIIFHDFVPSNTEPCSVPAASAFRDLTSHSGRARSDVTDAPRKLKCLQNRTEFRTECASEIK